MAIHDDHFNNYIKFSKFHKKITNFLFWADFIFLSYFFIENKFRVLNLKKCMSSKLLDSKKYTQPPSFIGRQKGKKAQETINKK